MQQNVDLQNVDLQNKVVKKYVYKHSYYKYSSTKKFPVRIYQILNLQEFDQDQFKNKVEELNQEYESKNQKTKFLQFKKLQILDEQIQFQYYVILYSQYQQSLKKEFQVLFDSNTDLCKCWGFKNPRGDNIFRKLPGNLNFNNSFLNVKQFSLLEIGQEYQDYIISVSKQKKQLNSVLQQMKINIEIFNYPQEQEQEQEEEEQQQFQIQNQQIQNQDLDVQIKQLQKNINQANKLLQDLKAQKLNTLNDESRQKFYNRMDSARKIKNQNYQN